MTMLQLGVFTVLVVSAAPATADASMLGSAQGFAVLAGSTMTNTGPSVLTGAGGVWPGTAVTGFPPGSLNGAMHTGDATAALAQVDVTIAYDALAGMTRTLELTGIDLGSLVLTPGVYFFSSSAQLTAGLVLDAQGDPDALFIFQIGSTLTTASDSSVTTINHADGCNVYWQVGSSATLGTDTSFQGNILAMASITLNTGASIIEGRALARTGAVVLDSNIIEAGCIPAPGTAVMLGIGGMTVARRRSRN